MISGDALLESFDGSLDGENAPVSSFPNQNSVNGLIFGDKSVYSSSVFPTNTESPVHSGTSSNEEFTEINKYSNPILRYINDILMDEEDDLESQPCMLQHCLALQATEKSFYDILTPGSSASPHHIHSPASNFHDENDNYAPCAISLESSSSYISTDRSNEADWSSYLCPEVAPDPLTGAQEWCFQHGGGGMHNSTPSGWREKRSHEMDDTTNKEEGRGSKISAVYSEDSEQSAVFDEVLVCLGGKGQCIAQEPSSESQISGNMIPKGSPGKANRSKKGANKGATVDLWILLTQCAQAVANYDQRNANELLKQIRQHSSPSGDGIERLSHYFADGLETRLAAVKPSHVPLDSVGATAADMLRAHKLYITASPFQRVTNFMTNRMIMKQIEDGRGLHIIDFGINYGFQWPCLIHHLSTRPGGPIKIRITGIDFPQPGFRPTERLEETGRRLANYSKRFNVPFEYNCVAQRWETVQLKDLKIDPSEVTVVNCMYRMKNLADETVEADCPRDAVLKIIRKIKPSIFMHGIANGTYNAPFFLTRVKEALFHFSTLYDILEANVGREDEQRAVVEKRMFGREAMNVIACEGAERVERPETYRQWQVRNHRAGFKQIWLDAEQLNKAQEFVRMEYHKDFVVDQNGKWVLLGWKGRIIHALSCWIAA
ncbi:scarecrow-like protein 11 [Prosopis cineraria]|uniref:scarecrow-like protein 11 n=1 Tax=Prosopis cineraria TaxID=364024 RepID=UPI00241038FF|nr:scarecrow-like protein 11 [Prosopis cineraria]